MNTGESANLKKAFFKVHKFGIIHLISVITLVPLLFTMPEKIYGVGVLCLWMVLWYAIEIMPPAITSLLPLVFIPYMGIIDSNTTCMSYMTNNTFFLILCFQFAVAFESSKTADYIAYKILRIMPRITPKILIIKFMAAAYFLSAVVPNALACSLLLPLSKSVINWYQSIDLHRLNRDEPVRADSYPLPTKLTTGFGLGIAYACTMGGMVSMGSSEAAFSIYGVYNKHLEGQSGGPCFWAYFLVGILVSLPLLIITCAYLEFLFFDLYWTRPEDQKISNEKYRQAILITENPLPNLEISNILIIVLWVVGCVLCIFAVFSPFVFNNNKIRSMYIQVSSYLMAVVFLLLVLPKSYTFCNYFRCRRPAPDTEKQINILQWSAVQNFIPWSYIFVYGASESIGYCFQRVHLQCKLGDCLKNQSRYLKSLSWMLFSVIFTSIAANEAIAQNFMNWALKMGFEEKLNDGISLYSIALGANIAFIMPISSISNCMATGWFNIRFRDVFLGGLVPTATGAILSDFVTAMLVNTLQPGFNQDLVFPNVSASAKEMGGAAEAAPATF